MPYAIKDGTVIKKDTGKIVGHSNNPKKYLRVLNAVEHGWVPTGKASGNALRNAVMGGSSGVMKAAKARMKRKGAK